MNTLTTNEDPSMPRSSFHLVTSPGRITLVVALGFLGASLSSPAWAKKKKDDAPAAAPEPTAPAGPIAPEPDAMGHVHFGPQSGEGLGRVSVKASPSDKIQVWLEGRYFGDAPMTIYSVPKGDYIIEGKFPDGKEVSKPVSVGENEEAVVDIASAKAASSTEKAGYFSGEISPQRLLLTKVFLGAAAASLVVGIVFGVLDHNAESDYEKTPVSMPITAAQQAQLDSIRSRGNRDVLIANIGYFTAGACLIAAGVAGYPMVIKPEKHEPTMALTIAPVVGHGTAGGTLLLRF